MISVEFEPRIVKVRQALTRQRSAIGVGELHRVFVDLFVFRLVEVEQARDQSVDDRPFALAIEAPDHVVGGEFVAVRRDHTGTKVIGDVLAIGREIASRHDAACGLLRSVADRIFKSGHVGRIVEGVGAVRVRPRLPIQAPIVQLRRHRPGLRADMLVEIDALGQARNGND